MMYPIHPAMRSPVMFSAKKKPPVQQAQSTGHPAKPWGHVNLEFTPDVARELHAHLQAEARTQYVKDLVKKVGGGDAKVTPVFPPQLSPETKKVLEIVRKNGMTLQATFAGVDFKQQPDLARFFIVSGDSKAAGERVIKALQKTCSKDLQAAYIVPPAELPSP